jgi:serine protease Do
LWIVAAGLVLACYQPPRDARPAADAGAPPRAAPAPVSPPSGPDFGLQFAEAAQHVGASIVAISSNGLADRTRRASGLQETPLSFLVRGLPAESKTPAHGIGSGVIVNDSGTILTNHHVVEGAESVRVQLADGREVDAKVVAGDARSDLAILRLDLAGKKLQAATLGDSDKLQVGEWVMACGKPFGSGLTVSVGVLSAHGRGSAGIAEDEDFIQTDATISTLTSGGPLVDRKGTVIGISTAMGASHGPASESLGFVIPINMARSVMSQLIDRGRVVRGDIGVYLGSVSDELAQSFGFHGRGGALVQDVRADSPAAQAGIQPGDIIVQADAAPVDNATSLRTLVASTAPSTVLKLQLFRDGKLRQLAVSVGELQEPTPAAGPTPSSSQLVWGLEVSDITPELHERLKLSTLSGAVVVQVHPSSPADDAGLRPGDIVASIGDSDVVDADQARRLLLTASSPVRLRIIHDGRGAFVIVRRGP